MKTLDLNCDMGESFGAWRMGDDAAVLEHVSSVNLACGFHAGDPATIRRTMAAAIAHGVAVGAHPSLPDLQGFGRREMSIEPQEAYDLTLYQIGAVAAFARAGGGVLHHVKPHGALYNMAAKNPHLAAAIARAIRDFDSRLILYGLSGSELVRAGRQAGIAVASEVFSDRAYQSDGSLAPRGMPNSVIHDAGEAVAQVVRMVTEGRVRCIDGKDMAIEADTLCIHGDAPQAPAFARAIRAELERLGVVVRAPG
jgi:5-oxoprolinase (ATP-hydrolysing) subunit A